MQQTLRIRELGLTDYETTWHAMQTFTAGRDQNTTDEFWLTEHNATFTLGLNRKDVRLPSRDDIPLVLVDRGGKITYHGPGQAVIYLLIDLKRKGLAIRQLVSTMESAIVSLLEKNGITAKTKPGAPGVYVNGSKIASLGLRLKNNCCYHGIALNIEMDLAPFDAIDPCGYQGLQVTQTRDLGMTASVDALGITLIEKLKTDLGYT